MKSGSDISLGAPGRARFALLRRTCGIAFRPGRERFSAKNRIMLRMILMSFLNAPLWISRLREYNWWQLSANCLLRHA